ncbi:hypothetical protein TIFTF001_025293 [Ficus carica]|uniref:Uncharacterized protein n=1 Tax=Ficus carica TaxID=3494 RepID=A0AA88AYP5_FICCA|nr:hypothetical protein TIFTF001_025293 [Ficus carica]
MRVQQDELIRVWFLQWLTMVSKHGPRRLRLLHICPLPPCEGVEPLQSGAGGGLMSRPDHPRRTDHANDGRDYT